MHITGYHHKNRNKETRKSSAVPQSAQLLTNSCLDTTMRLASDVKFAWAMMTSEAYSTSNASLITVDIRLACASDQKVKSSGSRSSMGPSNSEVASTVPVPPHETGISDGSLSRQRGTTQVKNLLTQSKFSDVGFSTKENNQVRFSSAIIIDSIPYISKGPSRLKTLYFPSW